MKRIVLLVVGLGVVLVAALVIFLFTGLGAAIRAAVEGVGSRATQTEVSLLYADVSLTSGEGTLKKLVVGNPKGYSTPSAIELGEIHVQIDTSTVTSDTVLISRSSSTVLRSRTSSARAAATSPSSRRTWTTSAAARPAAAPTPAAASAAARAAAGRRSRQGRRRDEDDHRGSDRAQMGAST